MEDEVLNQDASVDTGSETEQQPEETTKKVDYEALYNQSEQERKNLASLIGRQGQELGELRKMIQSQPKTEENKELNPYEYFDGETAKAIEKLTEQKAKALLESYQAQQEQARLRNDFQGVYNEYDVTEENLSDLAYYASAKNVTIRQAAESLASKGIIEKRTIKAAATPGKSPVDLKNAPTAPKVSGAVGKGSTDPTKMSPEQWAALPADQRETYLRKASGL